jgi:hypothetical protein
MYALEDEFSFSEEYFRELSKIDESWEDVDSSKIVIFNASEIPGLDCEKLNNTNDTVGRFGNHFFRNVVTSHIAKINNLSMAYSYEDKFNRLGIFFYKGGENTYEQTILTSNDNNFFDQILLNQKFYEKYVKGKNLFYSTNNFRPFGDIFAYWQTKVTSKFIKASVKNQQVRIIDYNPYKDKYQNNNSVFIHVRLGDLIEILHSSYEYYDKALGLITFDKGYISSDSIENDTCQKLIQKYGLEIYDGDEVSIIQFASTFKYLVLSSGTFSWMIGVFGFFSEIYYPKIKAIWHGDIFDNTEWNEIDY